MIIGSTQRLLLIFKLQVLFAALIWTQKDVYLLAFIAIEILVCTCGAAALK
jgi:hypothetical protein